MPYPLPLTRTEAYLAYKAGVIQQSDLKPSLAVPRNGIDAWLAYWTGLAEDYPKREDGTPHILQEEEAYIAYLCGVLDEYPEKCLRRVGAYLRYLISARWGRPDHPLNREELYLSLIKTQFIPSGDPSSDIVIDGTAKAPFVDVKLYGDTYQQSYNGSNLIDMPIVNGSRNGVTWVVNDDGSITLNGTATANVAIRVEGARIPAVAGETYTLSATGLQGIVNFGYKNSGSGANVFIVTPGSPVNTVQVTEEMLASANRLDMFFTTGASFNNQRVTLQLEKGSTATSYEPFVGGTPSPNPDYPQPIQTVTGRQVVNVTGKNRLRQIDGTYSRNGITATVNNGKITLNGTAAAIAYIPISASSDYYSLDLSGVYTLSATRITGVSYTIYHGASSVLYSTSSSQTKTLGGTYENVRFQINVAQGTTLNNVVVEAQLEAGSTATDYEPYSSNDYEINLGKNLFDKSSGNILAGYVPGSTIVAQEINRVVWIKCEPNTTYTISTRAESWSREVFTTKIAPAVGVAVTKLGQIGPGESSFTVQTDATAQFLAIRIWQQYLSGISLETELGNLQIELGSQATSYAPYFEPIELCKLGTYQDYIYKDGDDWKVHKATGEITLNGSEGDWLAIRMVNNYRYHLYITNIVSPQSSAGDTIGLCSHFSKTTPGEQWGSPAGSQSFIINNSANPNSSIGFTVGDSTDKLADFKTWLADNTPTVLYALYTPTDTVITDQNLIDQLNALKQGGAEEGTTYIKVSATDPNLPAKLYVEAPKYD